MGKRINKRDVIEHLYERGVFKRLLTPFDISSDLKQDVEHDIIEILLTKPNRLITSMYKKGHDLEHYTMRIIMNQLNSDKSPHHKTYNRYKKLKVDCCKCPYNYICRNNAGCIHYDKD